jgi:hypothetical protein
MNQHIKKVDIESFIKARIRIRSQTSGSDQFQEKIIISFLFLAKLKTYDSKSRTLLKIFLKGSVL